MNKEKLWSEIYKREDFQPAWSRPGMDRNMKGIIDRLIDENFDGQVRVLDIGCGNGRNSRVFDEYETDKILYTGLDYAEEAINFCRRTYGNSGRMFLHRDISDPFLSLHGPFQMIMDLGCFHAIPPELRSAYIKNVHSNLAEGGKMVLGTWLKRDGDRNIIEPSYTPYVILDEWFFDLHDIEELFCPRFKVTDSLIDSHMYEGINEGFIYFTLEKN